MTDRISSPGIYTIPIDVHHSDCCIGPSMSSSCARRIMETTPAEFWQYSYLNPNRARPEPKRSFDLGSAAHTALLEPERWANDVVAIDAPDYRTKAAQTERDEAHAAGKIPLLVTEHAQVLDMLRALTANPALSDLFANAEVEKSYIVQDESGMWLKSRADALAQGIALDYKTANSAAPEEFSRAAWDYGYYMQAAWNLDVIERVTGTRPNLFRFIVQEKTAPYLVASYDIDPYALEWGDKMNKAGILRLARCVNEGKWPGYSPDPVTIGLPSYAIAKLEARRQAGEIE